MVSPDEARELYEAIASEGLQWYGPNWRKGAESSEVQNRRSVDIGRIIQDITAIDGKRISRLPSPWHAALFLNSVMEHIVTEAPKEHPDGTIDPNNLTQRPVFRGETRIGRRVVASLYRDGVDQKAETCAVIFFCRMLEWLFRGKYPAGLDNLPLVATARHFGLSAPLIDLTADPAVAVAFASPPNIEAGREVVVYGVGLRTVLRNGGRIALPQVFVKRPYAQRGLFIASAEPAADLATEAFLQVRFPADPRFRIIRPGGPVDPLAEDKWLDGLVVWARAQVNSDRPLPKGPVEWAFFLRDELPKLGRPDFLEDSVEFKILGVTADTLADLLYWLAMRMTEKGEIAEIAVFEAIINDNPRYSLDVAGHFEIAARVEAERGHGANAARFRFLAETLRSVKVDLLARNDPFLGEFIQSWFGGMNLRPPR